MSNTFGIDAKMDHGRWPKTMANGPSHHSQGLRCWNTICAMSYFDLLTTEWKDIHAAASKANVVADLPALAVNNYRRCPVVETEPLKIIDLPVRCEGRPLKVLVLVEGDLCERLACQSHCANSQGIFKYSVHMFLRCELFAEGRLTTTRSL